MEKIKKKCIRKQKKQSIYIGMLMCLTLLISCIKQDEFGLSSLKEIKVFELPGQVGLTSINKVEQTVVIPMSDGADLSNLVPKIITISNLATISPSKQTPQDFSESVAYTVIAEDGSTAVWTVTAVTAEPNSQLPNSNFDLWYTVGNYKQPGESAEFTVWGTANRAVAIVGTANTIPVDLGGSDFAARLTSVSAPLLVRMAAATLFTGKFTENFPNPTDPRSNIDFGTPFNGRPSSFRIDYKYLPGASYEDADGNPLPGSDQCDIYVLLERKEGSSIERIGTGWFRSGVQNTDFSNQEVTIKYGPLTAADPEFEYANIRQGEVWGNPQATPTHITVVFSSSALGDFFTGAIGSELWINNFELVY